MTVLSTPWVVAVCSMCPMVQQSPKVCFFTQVKCPTLFPQDRVILLFPGSLKSQRRLSRMYFVLEICNKGQSPTVLSHLSFISYLLSDIQSLTVFFTIRTPCFHGCVRCFVKRLRLLRNFFFKWHQYSFTFDVFFLCVLNSHVCITQRQQDSRPPTHVWTTSCQSYHRKCFFLFSSKFFKFKHFKLAQTLSSLQTNSHPLFLELKYWVHVLIFTLSTKALLH